MATADQCGFIRRNELLLVIFAGLWKMLRSSPFLMEILPCPSGRPTSGMESNFSATDNPNAAVRMPDKSIYLAGQGCPRHHPTETLGFYPMPGGPVEINTTGRGTDTAPQHVPLRISVDRSGYRVFRFHQIIPTPFQ